MFNGVRGSGYSSAEEGPLRDCAGELPFNSLAPLPEVT